MNEHTYSFFHKFTEVNIFYFFMSASLDDTALGSKFFTGKGGKNNNDRAAFTVSISIHLNPSAFRKAKIIYNFGLSECNRVKSSFYTNSIHA